MSETLAGGHGVTIPTEGSDLDTWGNVLNAYTFPLFQKLMAGSETITLTGTTDTIVSTNGVDNEYRNLAWTFDGQGGAHTLTIPGNEAVKLVYNKNASYGITFNAGGTTANLPASQWGILLVSSTGNCTLLSFASLTGSEIGDDLFRIKGSSDATKKVAFEVDGLTTATTRTYTAPDASGTLTLLAATQTLSGKSFSDLLDISAAGAGQIKFPAAQNASADANTLDDYEEGTWTPVFVSSGATFSYASQIGHYTKIGNRAFITWRIQLNTSGNTLTANSTTITGVPFTNGNTVTESTYLFWSGSTSSFVNMSATLATGSTTLNPAGSTAAATANSVSASNALLHLTNGTVLSGQMHYKV